jgi:hypothetical protein
VVELGFVEEDVRVRPRRRHEIGVPDDLADPATMLRDGDDRNLGRLGLPPADEIKTLAADPKVHAFILAKASMERLRALLDDPAVRSVNVGDVAFDLGHPDIE